MKTSDIIAKAADIVDERGLSHEFYGHPQGPCCTLGALAVATGCHSPSDYPVAGKVAHGAAAAIAQHLTGAKPKYYCDAFSDVSSWNDAHDKGTVVNTLRSIASDLAAKGE